MEVSGAVKEKRGEGWGSLISPIGSQSLLAIVEFDIARLQDKIGSKVYFLADIYSIANDGT